MGRSPVLATSSVKAVRSEFSVSVPSATKSSPGIMRCASSADRVVNGDKLGAVGKGCLDLHLVDHFGHALHALLTGDDMGARLRHVRNRPAVTRALDHRIGDQGDRLGVV